MWVNESLDITNHRGACQPHCYEHHNNQMAAASHVGKTNFLFFFGVESNVIPLNWLFCVCRTHLWDPLFNLECYWPWKVKFKVILIHQRPWVDSLSNDSLDIQRCSWDVSHFVQVFTGWSVRFSMTECDAQHPVARQRHRRVSAFPVHLHNVSRLCGEGLRHFEGSSLPRCSSHPPCVTGASCVSGSSIFASSLHVLFTRKATLWIRPLMTLLVGGRESIPALALV